ncbi:sodium:proton antiporter [filamentous cyanobacterium CCP1]|nr:sodium:proton antiporter [filamentous cyanobacterium CCP2]PSB66418.1 sodium:proton antiporter [filamentous cyanobacterium CCP1]
MDNVTGLVTTLIILLLVATGVALITRRLRIPYVTGLVLAGLAVTELLPGQVGLNPELVLNLFLPILIFEASINTDISRLRSTVKPIALLAGPGIALASAITAVLLKYSLGFAWMPALFAGVILAITDTVSVIAVFKEVPVPSRLSTIVEGESLFNDGVALVLFSLIASVYTVGSITFLEGLQQLTVVIAGGTLVGLGFGYLSVGLSRQSDDALSDILLTVAVALGAFQVGQFLGVSGAVAVVVAGLVYGNLGIARSVSATAKITILSFWEYAGFGVNTFIFLLIGLEVDLITLWQTLPLVLIAILVYQAGRALTVYPLLALLRSFDRPIPIKWQHVLFLGNVKGSLSMALALSIPLGLPGREQVIPLVFGTVLVSLVGQGLSLPWLVKRLRLSSVSNIRQQVEESQIQLIAAKAAQDELDSLLKSGVLPKAVYEELRAAYQARVAVSERRLRDLYNQRPDQALGKGDDRTKLDAIQRRLLLAEKGAVNDALRKRIISEDLVQTYIQDLNERLLTLDDD